MEEGKEPVEAPFITGAVYQKLAFWSPKVEASPDNNEWWEGGGDKTADLDNRLMGRHPLGLRSWVFPMSIIYHLQGVVVVPLLRLIHHNPSVVKHHSLYILFHNFQGICF